jgi:hypothetical protein
MQKLNQSPTKVGFQAKQLAKKRACFAASPKFLLSTLIH